MNRNFRFKAHPFEKSLAACPNFALIGNINVIVVTARNIHNPFLKFVISEF